MVHLRTILIGAAVPTAFALFVAGLLMITDLFVLAVVMLTPIFLVLCYIAGVLMCVSNKNLNAWVERKPKKSAGFDEHGEM